MKLISTLLFSCLIALTSFSQSTSEVDPVDKLLTTTEVRTASEGLIKAIANQEKRKKFSVPKSADKEIDDAIDYDTYMAEVRALFQRSYSSDELMELTRLYEAKEMDNYKTKSARTDKELYEIGVRFGQKSIKAIRAVLEKY